MIEIICKLLLTFVFWLVIGFAFGLVIQKVIK